MQNSYRRLVVDLRIERTMFQSRILVKGKVVPNEIPENPDVCPLDCKKKRDLRLKRDLRFIEPQTVLLTRHHALGLFYCDGCPHLLFKSPIVSRLSKAPVSSEPPMESIKEKIAPLIAMTMTVDNKETRILNGDFKLLTKTMNKHLHTRGFDLICRWCDKPLEVGDLFHRTGLSRKTKKFYHKECWKSLLH